uniref:Uncharacterized protein n=1 Tax=Arundo donax TaxID=35708 RepID=A0A0A9EHJ1_ARUDO
MTIYGEEGFPSCTHNHQYLTSARLHLVSSVCSSFMILV